MLFLKQISRIFQKKSWQRNRTQFFWRVFRMYSSTHLSFAGFWWLPAGQFLGYCLKNRKNCYTFFRFFGFPSINLRVNCKKNSFLKYELNCTPPQLPPSLDFLSFFCFFFDFPKKIKPSVQKFLLCTIYRDNWQLKLICTH